MSLVAPVSAASDSSANDRPPCAIALRTCAVDYAVHAQLLKLPGLAVAVITSTRSMSSGVRLDAAGFEGLCGTPSTALACLSLSVRLWHWINHLNID